MSDTSWNDAQKHEMEMDILLRRRALETVKLAGATLSKDGNKWCWLLGENLQEGVAGFGDTPMKAAYDFCDKHFG